MIPPALVTAHRADLVQLVALAKTDLEELFRTLRTGDQARAALLDVLPELVLLYGEAAVALAADWYDDLREVEEVPGRFLAVPADLPGRDRTDALARWGISPLFQAVPDYDTARSKVAGGLQRIVADAARHTVILSTGADPRGKGWARRTAGGCDFCQMLAGRGAVYSADTADFKSHDDCNCVAVPVF